MPSPGYRSEDRYSTGRRRVRDRGVEIGLGIGAGLIASVVLGIVLLSGVTPRDSARPSGLTAGASPSASAAPFSTLSPLSFPSGSPDASLVIDEVPGATTVPVPGRTDPPPVVAGEPPVPVPTPRPARTQAPPPPDETPPPAPTEPPTPASPEPTPAPTPTPTPDASGPRRTVLEFYEAVENHLWDTATALWSESMQESYPPDVYLVDRFADTSRIDVTYAETVERGDGHARVEVALVEYRILDPTPRTIVGAWDLVRVDGAWLLDVPYF